MKTPSHILIFLLIFNSCSTEEERKTLTELTSYDFKRSLIDDKIGIVNLDSVVNFSELREKMGELVCEGKTSGLKFELNDTIYYLTGFAQCPTSVEVGCYFRVNTLFIKNDSLVVELGKNKKKEPIKYLKTKLDEIMAKTYNYRYNENKLNPAVIRFYVDDKHPISTTKRVLKEIVEQFESINSNNNPNYFEYTILFEEYSFTDIPPPPPPPVTNKFDN